MFRDPHCPVLGAGKQEPSYSAGGSQSRCNPFGKPIGNNVTQIFFNVQIFVLKIPVLWIYPGVKIVLFKDLPYNNYSGKNLEANSMFKRN